MPLKCKNHPVSLATVECKYCSAPLCDRCKFMTPSGVFCSESCERALAELQGGIIRTGPRRSRFSFFSWIRYTIIVGILLAVIYGALYAWLGTTDFGQMWDELRKTLRLLF